MTGMTKQPMFCNACGTWFEDFVELKSPNVCSTECMRELNWRRSLQVCGEAYRSNVPPKLDRRRLSRRCRTQDILGEAKGE